MPGWPRGSASTESEMDAAAGLTLTRLEELEAPPLSLAQLFWRRFRRHNMALVGVVVLVLLTLYAVFGSFFRTEAYANLTETGLRLQSPSAAHPYGTDTVGRDILARTIYGGQISLLIGLSALLGGLGVGGGGGGAGRLLRQGHRQPADAHHRGLAQHPGALPAADHGQDVRRAHPRHPAVGTELQRQRGG